MELATIVFIVFVISLSTVIAHDIFKAYFYSYSNTGIFSPIVISHTLSDRTSSTSKIPKIIWTYWHSLEDIPDFVGKCIDSFRKHNPDHKVIILHNRNLSEYVPEVDFGNLRHGQKPVEISDFARLHVLRKYGGIWSDASTICNKSLNEWVHKLSPEYEFVGFLIPKYYKNVQRDPNDMCIVPSEEVRNNIIPESWFLAAEKDSKFIRLWCDEFMRLNQYSSRTDYLRDLRKQGVTIPVSITPYLCIHASAIKVIQLDKYPLGRLKIYESLLTALYYFSINKLSFLNPLRDIYIENNIQNIFSLNAQNHIHFIFDNKDIFKELEIVKFTYTQRKYILQRKFDFDKLTIKTKEKGQLRLRPQ